MTDAELEKVLATGNIIRNRLKVFSVRKNALAFIATPVMNYAFDSLGFEKLIFANAAGNNRSRRVKEKTGARLLRLEPAEYVNPEYKQREVWELTKQEWCKLQGR